MTTYAGSGGVLFRSSVERKFLFYLLAGSASAALVAVAVLVPFLWIQSRHTAFVVTVVGASDFALTTAIAFALRRVDVTFDGRRVRLGSSIFKTSVPVGDIVAAEALTETGGGPFRSREYVKLVTATGAHRVPCRNAESLVQLIEYYRGGGG
ncbi:MAG: hypothetical protein JSU81_02410 [Candidatus Coatesbacteria bacterium]|nr:MAG: hypothetical protein JSU81_02410 [Candidatus Coatesbacteria bacterium]